MRLLWLLFVLNLGLLSEQIESAAPSCYYQIGTTATDPETCYDVYLAGPDDEPHRLRQSYL